MSAVAFETSLAETHPRALEVATRLLGGNRTEAEDVVADVLGRLWERSTATGEVYGTGYVVRSVVNAIRDRSRRAVRQRRALARLAGSSRLDRGDRPDDLAVDRVDAERLLAGLPAHQRRLLQLRYLEGLAQDDVAATLGIARGTVASGSARALDRLRALAG